MLSIKELKLIWNNALLNKTITKILYDENRFLGFLLNDGTKVSYDSIRGLELMIDPNTGESIRYN